MSRTAALILFSLTTALCARAGGPAYVAGISYFDPSVTGKPLTWAQGAVIYYTDQGDLSPALSGPSADSFVASAFSLWTSIPTAAVGASRGGQLAEDVTGANLAVSNGAISTPMDIAPSATSTPFGIVYDKDGSVTDALLGSGASDSLYCRDNSVFGGVDNFNTNAQFTHALVVLNGKCAQNSSQLPDLQYHLARTIGRVLGLDWSQANLNVIVGNPSPTSADIAGFPLMHEFDPSGCVPVANCYSSNGTVNPAQPKIDDQAALSRLYPVTAQNLASFPGKQVFSQSTARIHGSVYFTGINGTAGGPMQGVNVVARWIDPSTGQPSGFVVVTSISGFLFCGNAGNVVTGFTDIAGNNLDRFGSNASTLEGFYDLAGLPIPNGANSAQFQLSVEAVDPLWSSHAGPYGSTSQVQPSGSAQPILVTVSPGGDIEQDILMQNSARHIPQWYGNTTYAAPKPLPPSGNWAGALGDYGNADFFQFSAQANRTLSVVVTAIGDSNAPSESKMLPVIGIWAMSDPGRSPAPANTPSAFNTTFASETRLDAKILQSTNFRVGISDYRGDGRPDYRYAARLLYGDSVIPSRAGISAAIPVSVSGLGLQPNTAVQIAGQPVAVLAKSATRLLVNTPPMRDGTYDLTLSDSSSGAQSTMTGALTIGAGPTDTIKMLCGANPATPVGGQAPVPFTVQVLAADGVTSVAGASIQFNSAPATALSACSGAASCTVVSDQNGTASTYMSPLSAGVISVIAKLAPASYSSSKQVQTTLLGTESQLDLSLLTPPLWIAQGTTTTLPIAARLLSNGVPVPGTTLNYAITAGQGSLSAASAQTDSKGNASVNLQITSAAASLRVTICAAPNNAPCQVLNLITVQNSSLQLQAVSGTLQLATAGQSFQAVSVRVVDSASPPHPVLGANVSFVADIGRLPKGQPIVWAGESNISQPVMPTILSELRANAQSDVNGVASFALSTGGISGNVAILGSATTGGANLVFEAQQLGE